jgi:phosphatidylglycerophosphate synthase
MFSLLCGASAGVLLARPSSAYLPLAAVLLQAMIVFDCADGQLARITGGGSKFGRVVDTYADLTAHGFIFTGTAIGIYQTSGTPLVFLLAFLSLVSMHYHLALFDHFKSVYISMLDPDQADRLVCLKNMKDRLAAMKGSRSPLVNMIANMYMGFYKLESRIVSIGYPPYSKNFYELFPDLDRIDLRTRNLYTREMRIPTKLWTLIGDTIHLEIFVLCALIIKPSFIFPLILLYTNTVMIIALIVQRTKYKNLGLEHEAFLQERFG